MGKRIAIVSNTSDLGVLIVRNLLIKLVREQEPGSFIAILADADVVEKTRDFYRRHSWIDDCIALEAARAPSAEARLIKVIMEQRFDCMILSPESKFPAWIPYFCKVPVRVAFVSDPTQRMYVNQPVSLAEGVAVKDTHWTEILSGYARALGIKTFKGAGNHVPFFRVEGPDIPRAVGNTARVVVHAGGNAEWNRRWPLVNFEKLCAKMETVFDVSIALIGGAIEGCENEAIVRAVKKENPSADITNLAGASLAQTALYIKAANLFVGNDSGPMNLAVALGTPVVAIRGADPENFRADRVDAKHLVISNWRNCSRCIDQTHLCRRGCPIAYDRESQRYPKCMEAISFEEVWGAVRQQFREIKLNQNDYTNVST